MAVKMKLKQEKPKKKDFKWWKHHDDSKNIYVDKSGIRMGKKPKMSMKKYMIDKKTGKKTQVLGTPSPNYTRKKKTTNQY